MDTTIGALEHAVRERDGRALRARADALLELVDDTEQLYSHR
jgi:hypothetical protein